MKKQAIWALIAMGAVALSCDSGSNDDPYLPLPPPVTLHKIEPLLILPGTILNFFGDNFVDSAEHSVTISGTITHDDSSDPLEVDVTFPLTIISLAEGKWIVDEDIFIQAGEGIFQGSARIFSTGKYGTTVGDAFETTMTLVRHLNPVLETVADGPVYLNTEVFLAGDGFLLGGKEGQTFVNLEGCYLDHQGECASEGVPISAQVPLQHLSPSSRQRAYFEFSPSILGLTPGNFEGTINILNVHSDGQLEASAPIPILFQLHPSQITGFSQPRVSLGQFLDLQGVGFTGGNSGSTLISFTGQYTEKGKSPKSVTFDFIPTYLKGYLIRSVIEEEQGLGIHIDLRREGGTLSGTWTPTVIWGPNQSVGKPTTLELVIGGVKQVVWVRFTSQWFDSLDRFGLGAVDPVIRQRVIEIMRRDYRGLNVEFRTDEPQDFNLFARLDIGGKDPNGYGMLGYDNTPGKDVGNMRLYDWIGGVNALTQEVDGYPGYGGVFLDSLLGFSEHPPSGVKMNPLNTSLFDQIFDPFRPDIGESLSLTEAQAVSLPESAGACPAQDRPTQAACAIIVLSNVIGSTAAHELGHSFGLANPQVPGKPFHNVGDKPDRLMDSGESRSFEERSQLNGAGPSVFCDYNYFYLKKLLPLDPPDDPDITRPPC